jgi:hypothetical protein
VVCAVNGVAAGAGANLAFAVIRPASTEFIIQSFSRIVDPESGGTSSCRVSSGCARIRPGVVRRQVARRRRATGADMGNLRAGSLMPRAMGEPHHDTADTRFAYQAGVQRVADE